MVKVKDDRKWFWFRVVKDGVKCDMQHWFTTYDGTTNIARNIMSDVLKFNKGSRVYVEIIADDTDLGLIGIVANY